jgi:hypothetical protein
VSSTPLPSRSSSERGSSGHRARVEWKLTILRTSVRGNAIRRRHEPGGMRGCLPRPRYVSCTTVYYQCHRLYNPVRALYEHCTSTVRALYEHCIDPRPPAPCPRPSLLFGRRPPANHSRTDIVLGSSACGVVSYSGGQCVYSPGFQSSGVSNGGVQVSFAGYTCSSADSAITGER